MFIHSSIDRLLAVVSNAGMQCIYLCLNTCFSFLSGIFLGIEWLDHMIILCSTFWIIAKLFQCLICLHPHQQCMRIPSFPTSLAILVTLFFWCVILVHVKWCVFVVWFAFLRWWMMLSILSYDRWIYVIFGETSRVLCQS